jgi:predicted metalloendopeptidase
MNNTCSYDPTFNSITFPAAIMVSPMFNRTYPKAYNFAHVGSVMGHELGHGFDNSGVSIYL